MVKQKIAKGIRVVTVPPVLVSAMLLILYQVYGDEFASGSMLLCGIFFLALLPVLAYPLASWGYQRRKHPSRFLTLREKQRNLAFLLTPVGYFLGWIAGRLGHCSAMMMGVLTGYLMGVILLTVLNKGFHIKASGHACSCVMAYLLLGEWLGLGVFFICVPLYLGEFWASVSLKRHTVKEFIGGTGVAVVAFLAQKFLYLM